MGSRFLTAFVATSVALYPVAVNASPYSIDLLSMRAPVEEPADVDLPETTPQTATLDEGELAPFTGTLLNPAAAARVVVERETQEQKCRIEVDRAVDVKRAEMQLEADNLKASLDAAVKRQALEEEYRKKQVDALSHDLERAQKQGNSGKWNGLYFAGGVVAGVLIIVAGAFAVRGVREANL